MHHGFWGMNVSDAFREGYRMTVEFPERECPYSDEADANEWGRGRLCANLEMCAEEAVSVTPKEFGTVLARAEILLRHAAAVLGGAKP